MNKQDRWVMFACHALSDKQSGGPITLARDDPGESEKSFAAKSAANADAMEAEYQARFPEVDMRAAVKAKAKETGATGVVQLGGEELAALAMRHVESELDPGQRVTFAMGDREIYVGVGPGKNEIVAGD